MNPTLKGLDQWPNVVKEDRNQPNPDWVPSDAPVVVFGNVATQPAPKLNPDWITADMELGGQPTPFSRFWMEQGHASPVPEIVKRAYQAGYAEGSK